MERRILAQFKMNLRFKFLMKLCRISLTRSNSLNIIICSSINTANVENKKVKKFKQFIKLKILEFIKLDIMSVCEDIMGKWNNLMTLNKNVILFLKNESGVKEH